MAGVPVYIVHLSCADALEKVKQARDMGLPAYAETCPQYLFLSYDDYERRGLRGREVRDVAAAAREVAPGRAVEGAASGTTSRSVSTDHCPFCMNEPPQKQLGPGRLLEDSKRRARASRRG